MRKYFIVLALTFCVSAASFAAPTDSPRSIDVLRPGKANKPLPPPAESQYPRTRGAVSRDDIVALFDRGVQRDLAGACQSRKLAIYLAALNDVQVANLYGLLQTQEEESAQVFLLKSYVAGETWENLLAYATDMVGKDEATIIARSTMRDDMDLVQQWQDACGPSMLQTVAGEADPRFAWELNKLGDITKIDPMGASSGLAGQQKEWLEQYGGKAVPRGQSGKGIVMTEFLNAALGPVVGARFVCQASTNIDYTLNRVSDILRTGYDVPLCIAWDAGGTNNHFLVMLAVKGQAGSRQFQIHDSWTGKTAWVGESSIRQNSLAPIFTSYARLSHYYEPFPN